MKIFNREIKLCGFVNSDGLRILERDHQGKILRCTGTAVPTGAGYAKGCLFIKTDAATGVKGVYENQGTTASASFTASVALANLAAGIAPSHVVKFFRLGSTITTTALAGLAVGDLVVTVVADGTVTVAACAVANTLPADPADTSYVIVFRATA